MPCTCPTDIGVSAVVLIHVGGRFGRRHLTSVERDGTTVAPIIVGGEEAAPDATPVRLHDAHAKHRGHHHVANGAVQFQHLPVHRKTKTRTNRSFTRLFAQQSPVEPGSASRHGKEMLPPTGIAFLLVMCKHETRA